MFGRPLRAGFRAASLGGRGPIRATRGDGMPAWWRLATVGEWYSISGTGASSASIAGLNNNAYGDMALRPSDSSLYIVAAGGHSDGSSNGAATIRLSDDAPAWTVLRASTWNGSESNVDYYADGSPCSRHTYHYTHYIESLDAVLLAGCKFGYGASTPVHGGMDLFDLATNTYLPRYTWPDITPYTGWHGVVLDGSGNVWTSNGYKFNVSTEAWSKPGSGSLLRFPAAYDSIRDRLFAMQFGDGQDNGALSAAELDPATGNSQTITFNSSSALTALSASAPAYCGMAYCPLDGKFYFADPSTLNTLYVITPNAGTTWDISTLSVGGVSISAGSLLNKRLLWVPALSGFVLQPDQSATLKFLRMV